MANERVSNAFPNKEPVSWGVRHAIEKSCANDLRHYGEKL
jgi:hypothetical protein